MSLRAEQRRREILALLEGGGYVSVDRLVEHFNVTPQTLRADLNALSRRNLLVRRHGGASLPSSTVNTSYALRRVENEAAKASIARAVAEHIPDGSSLFLALGTTVEAVAHALCRRQGLKIVTNNPDAARILGASTDFEIFVAGGVLQRRNGGIVGVRAAAFVAEFRCDFAVMSCGGIDRSGALLDFHDSETCVMQAMMANARRTLLAADAGKFERAATHRLAALGDVAALFADRRPPPWLRAIARARGVETIVAS